MPQLTRFAAGPSFPAAHDKLPHVLFIVDGFPKALGGGERVVLRLAALLPRYGFRASILTFAMHAETTLHSSEAPCPIFLLPLQNTYGPGALGGMLTLGRFLRSERVDVVQTFFESSDLWGGLVTRLFSRAKLVWSRRDMGILRGGKHRLAYRALRRWPHAVAAVSRRVAEHVIRVDQVPAKRVHVIHNGLDLESASSASVTPSSPVAAPVFTTIGNIRHVKGHDIFLEAAAVVVRSFPDARFTIAGEVLEPEYFRSLQQRVQALGLIRNVEFLGKITDMREHLSTASVFVLPSRSEGFSNALVEAMAAGLPSIASDVGGNAEAIEDGKSGLLVSANDATALAQAMLKLLRDPALASAMGRAADLRAKREFSADAMMRKTVRLYAALLS